MKLRKLMMWSLTKLMTSIKMLTKLTSTLIRLLREMKSMKVSKAFKYPAAADAQVRITNKAALGKVLDDVKKKMSIVCCLVHYLLRRHVHTSNNMKYLEFNFGGNKAQFRKNEFGIITGLKMGPVPANNPASSYDRIRDNYFNGFDVITNAMVKDAYTNTTQWMEDDDMVKLSLLYILECSLLGKESHSEIKLDHMSMVDDLPTFNAYPGGNWHGRPLSTHFKRLWRSLTHRELIALEGVQLLSKLGVWGYKAISKLGRLAGHKSDAASLCEENMLTVSEHGHDEHHDDVGHDIVEPPLKRVCTNIHEGVDAYHSIPQQSPHQNVQQFEAASSRQLIQSNVASLKKQFDDHQQYVKSELMSIKETLKCILTLILMDKKSVHKKYIIPLSMQDEDEVVKIVHTEEEVNNNEYVNKEESVNKMEDTYIVDIQTGQSLKYDGGLDIGVLGYKRLRRKVRNVKSSYIVNKDLKKRLKNTLHADQFNPMKPTTEGKRKNKKAREPMEWTINEFLMGYAWGPAYSEALNVVEANQLVPDEVSQSTSSVVHPKHIVLHDVLHLRFMSQMKLDEVLDEAFCLLRLRFMSQR
ncbi:hypothetical protein FNV43_RR19660 [Rhamnella rubrinervis]|uniref:DUF1985 domain-containing protein n=1 Tax=Rhamnella rubrinervis TaxID=2594499 RepID=A0A8K0DT36_9ROSA|nr:hypothetical protein FNV43_RR19660 [Rhamnella rubrinervis]